MSETAVNRAVKSHLDGHGAVGGAMEGQGKLGLNARVMVW